MKKYGEYLYKLYTTSRSYTTESICAFTLSTSRLQRCFDRPEIAGQCSKSCGFSAWVSKILVRLALPREPQANTFSCHLTAPKSTLAALPPFFARAFFAQSSTAASPGGFRKNDLQVALL
jgi:hypothetical protein